MRQAMLSHRTTALAIAAGVALALAACGGGGDGAAEQPVTASELRASTNLNARGWKFLLDATTTMDANAAESALASGGEAVALPHTWNASDAASTSNTVPYKRGKGSYRIEFDNAGGGATSWLQFDGASIVADMWLNGEKLGQHKGAFTAFRFDVTGKLKASKNVLPVQVDNTAAKTNADLTASDPLSDDFNMAGGLYRGVSLISTPSSAHFALDDLGSSDVFARTSSLSGEKALTNLTAKLKNNSRTSASGRWSSMPTRASN